MGISFVIKLDKSFEYVLLSIIKFKIWILINKKVFLNCILNFLAYLKHLNFNWRKIQIIEKWKLFKNHSRGEDQLDEKPTGEDNNRKSQKWLS